MPTTVDEKTADTKQDGNSLSPPEIGKDPINRGVSRNEWLVCTAAFAFDLEIGQAVECMYPIGALSPRDAKTLSFLAFPDSNLTRADTDDISCLYSFRFRCQDPVMSDQFFEANSNSGRSRYLFATCLFRQHRDDGNLRGFYQKTIAVVSRHPFTDLWSSVVSGPMAEAYSKAERCGKGAAQVLQEVWMETSQWPKPKPAKRVNLPIMSTRIPYLVPIGGSVAKPNRKVVGSNPSGSPSGGGHAVLTPRTPVSGSRERFRETVCGDGDVSLEKTLTYLYADSRQVEKRSKKRGTLRGLVTATRQQQQPSEQQTAASSSSATSEGSSDGGGVGGLSLSSTLQGHQVPWFLYSEVSVSRSLWPLMGSLWHLWEMAITGVPMLVYTPRQLPSAVSNAVLAILSLIQPIQYKGDYRPYFTIYDPDYEYYKTAPSGALQSCIIGITSPMAFAQLSQNFPVVVVLDGDGSSSSKKKEDCAPLPDKVIIQQQGSSYIAISPLLCSSSSNTRTLTSKFMEVTGAASVMAAMDGGTGGQKTEYRRDLERWKLDLPSNSSVLKQLQVVSFSDGKERQSAAFAIDDAILNRHFQSLTCSFLAPFIEPYLSVEDAKRRIKSSPLSPTPLLPPFDLSSLLTSLELPPSCPGPISDLKAIKLQQLYRKFVVESPNFWAWMKSQEENSFERIIRYHAKVLCDSERVDQCATGIRSIGDFDAAITVVRQVRDDPSVRRLKRVTKASSSAVQTAVGSSGSSDGRSSPRREELLEARLSRTMKMLSDRRKDFIQSHVQVY
ncbi:Protein dennd6a [Perkinsus chesapeaki]|uniref:Protein dennd6a n=1 Tax=Perkinsus chesapeaki TaxID=330153 RepID=A0A7J6M2W3_PERCH|nr:Protein dennd6a [Perkinsus chesapeaki]